MNDQNIRRAAQKILYCPECGRTYNLEEIKLRGFVDKTYILQTTCANHHTPVLTLFVTSLNLGQPMKIQKALSRPITYDDVLDAHDILQDFNGDFRSLFREK